MSTYDRGTATVPNENSVQPLAAVIPPGQPLKQFSDLFEFGDRNSRMHACAREPSSETDFKGLNRDTVPNANQHLITVPNPSQELSTADSLLLSD